MTKKSLTFTLKVDEKDIEFKVYEPTLQDRKEADKVRNKTFSETLACGAPLRSQISLILRKRGVWNDELESKLTEIGQQIINGERRLAEGGFSLDEARKLADTIASDPRKAADLAEKIVKRI